MTIETIDTTLATSNPGLFLEQVARKAYAAVETAQIAHDALVEKKITAKGLTGEEAEEYRILNRFGKDDKHDAIDKAFKGIQLNEEQLQSVQKILPDLLNIMEKMNDAMMHILIESMPDAIASTAKKTQQSTEAVKAALHQKREPIEKTTVVVDCTLIALGSMMSKQQMDKAFKETGKHGHALPAHSTLVALDKAASRHVLTQQMYPEVKPESTFSWFMKRSKEVAREAYGFADKISHEMYPRNNHNNHHHKPK